MPSITSWTRLEPSTRVDDPATGLEARVEDPLWLLARQRQLGELRGEDAGSPAIATLRLGQAAISRYLPRALARDEQAQGEPIDGRRPLEPLVARDPTPPDLRLRARAGQRLLDALGQAGLHADRARYLAAAPLDPSLSVLAGRVADGLALRSRVQADAEAQPPPASPLREILGEWISWWDARVGGGASAWRGDRLEYQCSIGAGDGPALVATQLETTDLDWYRFDAQPGASLAGTTPATERRLEAIPSPVRYAGMPATRFWQFEDARVYFGGIDVDPEDLGRLLLVEFALVGADDWFVIPVPLAIGSVHSVVDLVVTDVFGVATTIPPVDTGIEGARWSMFRASHGGASRDEAPPLPILVLPPTAATALVGGPVERVDFVRDEGANLAWAIEHLAQDPLGLPVDLHAREAAGAPAMSPPASTLSYRVRTELPSTWIPLVPREISPGVMQLERGRLLGSPSPLPRTSIVSDTSILREEALPRDGLEARAAWRYARWIDGSIHIWRAREVLARSSTPDSHLAHDILTPKP